MEDDVGDIYLKRLPQIRLNFIDGYISSYFSIINSPEQLDMINQEGQVVSVLDNIQSEKLGDKEDRKKRAMEVDYQSKNKAEHKHMRGGVLEVKGS